MMSTLILLLYINIDCYYILILTKFCCFSIATILLHGDDTWSQYQNKCTTSSLCVCVLLKVQLLLPLILIYQ